MLWKIGKSILTWKLWGFLDYCLSCMPFMELESERFTVGFMFEWIEHCCYYGHSELELFNYAICVTWQKSYFGETIATVLNVPCHLRKFTVNRYSNPSPSLWTSDDLGDNSSTSFASSTARSGSPSSHYGNGSPRSNQTSSLVALRNNSPSVGQLILLMTILWHPLLHWLLLLVLLLNKEKREKYGNTGSQSYRSCAKQK